MQGNYITGTSMAGIACSGFILDTIITMTPVSIQSSTPLDIRGPQQFPMALTAYLVLGDDDKLHQVSPAAISSINLHDEFVQRLGLVRNAKEEPPTPHPAIFEPKLIDGAQYNFKVYSNDLKTVSPELQGIYSANDNLLHAIGVNNIFEGRDLFCAIDIYWIDVNPFNSLSSGVPVHTEL